MLHPSYTDLINAVNSEVEPGEQPVVQSRYSIVLATSKRARQIIGGDEPLIARAAGKKPLSIAVQELYEGKVKILGDNDAEEAEEAQEEAETRAEEAEQALDAEKKKEQPKATPAKSKSTRSTRKSTGTTSSIRKSK